MEALIGIGDVELVPLTEIVIDLDVDLVAIDVVFDALLSANQTVASAHPFEYSRIQTVAAGEVIGLRHSGDHTLNVAGLVESRAQRIASKDAHCLEAACRGSRLNRIAQPVDDRSGRACAAG